MMTLSYSLWDINKLMFQEVDAVLMEMLAKRCALKGVADRELSWDRTRSHSSTWFAWWCLTLVELARSCPNGRHRGREKNPEDPHRDQKERRRPYSGPNNLTRGRNGELLSDKISLFDCISLRVAITEQ